MNRDSAKRIAAGAIVVAGLVTPYLMREEGFDPIAVRPVPSDPCTVGHGSTFHADGTPVKCGETITRPEARKLLEFTAHDVYEAGINKCAGDIPMYPHEKAILVRLAYQMGAGNVCRFSIIKKFRAGEYEAGCKTILTMDLLHGRHCSLPENRYRKDGCNGLMNRREEQFKECTGATP